MQKQLAACGVELTVVRNIAEVHPLLKRDGAAVIEGPECGEEATRALARQIFAEQTLAIPDAARVFEGGEFDHARVQASNNKATPAHTDGFAYGDRYPDYMLLSCVQESAKGGESVLIDGHKAAAIDQRLLFRLSFDHFAMYVEFRVLILCSCYDCVI